MRKEFKIVDKERGIAQITTDDERFYVREGRDGVTGLPTHIYLPSSTWIAGFCPKGIGFYKWLADKGWDEAEAIKTDRGKYGTRVHKAIELLLNGNDVMMDEVLPDPEGDMSPLTSEEYQAVLHFTKWWEELQADHEKIEVYLTEEVIWCEPLGFAGTVDLVLKVDGEWWIIDFKTSQQVTTSHRAQLSSYKHGLVLDTDNPISGDPRLFVLQIGYRRTKKGYKLTEVEDCIELWKAAKMFWADEHSNTRPSQVQLPLTLSLGMKQNRSKGKATKKVTKKTTK